MKLHKNSQDFSELIRLTAAHFNIIPEFVEKDYWITLILNNLSQSLYANSVVFKGGTSLTKAYRIINRFSEDIDIEGGKNYPEENKKDLLKVTKSVSVSVAKLYKDIGDNVADEEITEDILKEKDLADLVKERTGLFSFMVEDIKRKREILDCNTMMIPQIKIYDDGKANYKFEDFTLDVSEMNYAPLDNEIELQNLISNEIKIMRTCGLNFQVPNPVTAIAMELRNKPEVSDECTELLSNLITGFLTHLKKSITTRK